MSCPYKFLFGKPEQGVHSYTFFGFAVVDTVLTILGAILTTYFTGLPFLLSLGDWFFIGETMHYAFGTETRLFKYMGWKTACD